jgi:lipopolysaccharide biosynthesis glycosyltransferase
LDDIAKLYQIELGDNYLAAACNHSLTYRLHTQCYFHKKLYHLDVQDYLVNKLGLAEPQNYFQAGVLVLNIKKLNLDQIFQKFFAKLENLPNPYFLEQDILNCLCGAKTLFVSQAWNLEAGLPEQLMRETLPDGLFQELLMARENPKIIHFNGPRKPWFFNKTPYAAQWWSYARKTPFYEQILKEYLSEPKTGFLGLRGKIRSRVKFLALKLNNRLRFAGKSG